MFSFSVAGNPVGKQRPRVTRKGFAFTPKKTVDYERLIKNVFCISYPHHKPLTGNIRLSMLIYIGITKTDAKNKKRKAKMLNNEIRPAKKPDIDNIIKSVADALNKVAYVDDKQIVSISAAKYYAESSRIDILIEEI